MLLLSASFTVAGLKTHRMVNVVALIEGITVTGIITDIRKTLAFLTTRHI
jgi:hypothetical protein